MRFDAGFAMLIGGELVRRKQLTILKPANEQTLATAPDATAAELDAAIAAASLAFPSWAATTTQSRRDICELEKTMRPEEQC